MRLLFIGDVFSTPGMRAVQAYLGRVADDYDLVVVNGENAAGGFGITRSHFERLRAAGADVVTLGNHSWDQREALELVEETPRLIRPLNYPPGTPGLGAVTLTARDGSRVTVAQAMGRVYMDALDDPFRAVDRLVDEADGVPLVVDFHAEATSEKKVMGYHLAGRAAAVIGTHTHVQTADEAIHGGTAYITDVGMSGVQHSSIGMDFPAVHHRFVRKTPMRFRPADGAATVCALSVEIRGERATSVERIQWRHEPGHEADEDEGG